MEEGAPDGVRSAEVSEVRLKGSRETVGVEEALVVLLVEEGVAGKAGVAGEEGRVEAVVESETRPVAGGEAVWRVEGVSEVERVAVAVILVLSLPDRVRRDSHCEEQRLHVFAGEGVEVEVSHFRALVVLSRRWSMSSSSSSSSSRRRRRGVLNGRETLVC